MNEWEKYAKVIIYIYSHYNLVICVCVFGEDIKLKFGG